MRGGSVGMKGGSSVDDPLSHFLLVSLGGQNYFFLPTMGISAAMPLALLITV